MGEFKVLAPDFQNMVKAYKAEHDIVMEADIARHAFRAGVEAVASLLERDRWMSLPGMIRDASREISPGVLQMAKQKKQQSVSAGNGTSTPVNPDFEHEFRASDSGLYIDRNGRGWWIIYPDSTMRHAKKFVREVLAGFGQQIGDDECERLARQVLDNLRTR